MKKFFYYILTLLLLFGSQLSLFPSDTYSFSNKLPKITSHIISIELFPETFALMATDTMMVESFGEGLTFFLNKDFSIKNVKVDGLTKEFKQIFISDDQKSQKFDDDNVASDFSKSGWLQIKGVSEGKHEVSITYQGNVYDEPKAAQFSREYIANQTSGIISERGTYLSPDTFWYPQGSEEMSQFGIRTVSPEGYETVTQGTRVDHKIKNGKLFVHWENKHLADVLFLQAGPYHIQEDSVDDIRIYTYFFKGGEKLGTLYLKKSKQYIEMYNQLLGRYPYKKFAVVENFFDTGYGMPSWTLLGSTVVRLPFIPDTSLPHEICHNWWGNGVFVDYSLGNWCEGLTVYCADYLLKKKNETGGDIDYRKQINRDYSSYVKSNNDFPLLEFRSRHNPATRAIGYGKVMMVFHDLYRKIGEDKFFAGLRQLMKEYRFKKAGWREVLRIFEIIGTTELDDFYEQWVKQKGSPVLSLSDVSIKKNQNGFNLNFTITQHNPPHSLDVPLQVFTEKRSIFKNIKLEKTSQNYTVFLKTIPQKIEVDPEHHIFRKLYPEEIPPSIAKVFGSEKQIIVIADKEKYRDTLKKAAEMLNKTKTATIKFESEVTLDHLKDSSIIFLGDINKGSDPQKFLKKVRKEPPWEKELSWNLNAASVVVLNHPGNLEYAIMEISGNSQMDLLSVIRKLPHYGKYSYLLFQGDKNVVTGIWPVESSPLIYKFK